MKTIIVIAVLIHVFAMTVASNKRGKWVKINEASYLTAEQLLRNEFLPAFAEFDLACSEADWEIGNAYTKLNFDIGVSMPTGRGYFAEILCPFTEQEIYSLYAIWTSSLDENKKLIVDHTSVEFFTDLNQLGEKDPHIANLAGVEASLYDMGDILDFLINSYLNVVKYYSDVYDKVNYGPGPQGGSANQMPPQSQFQAAPPMGK